MNHETLKALYQFDVDEVGEEEAAKRWEVYDSMKWIDIPKFPLWFADDYRRKPGIPWPKVMQSEQLWTKCVFKGPAPEPFTCWSDWVNSPIKSGVTLKTSTVDDWKPVKESSTQWPADAPESSKPAKQKIDWAKLSPEIKSTWGGWSDGSFPSRWIAWNCDEYTRGNPLPDGLVVEWFGADGPHKYPRYWDNVTRFRIVGIKEGWE